MMNNLSIFIGATLIVAGTTIGAGMLALPLTAAKIGLLPSLGIFAFFWAIMCYTGCLLVDVIKRDGDPLSTGLLARKYLGRMGEIICSVAFIILFFSLLSAYTAAGSTLLQGFLDRPWPEVLTSIQVKIMYVGLFGGLILFKTKVIDHTNRWLFLAKIIVFILLILALIPYADGGHLPLSKPIFYGSVLPVIFTSFGFHGSIPALVQYVGLDKVNLIKRSIIIGSLLPLFVYTLWVSLTLSVLPQHGALGFEAILKSDQSLDLFIKAIAHTTNSLYVSLNTQIFSFLAIVTSYIGVGIGVFQFVGDLFNIPANKKLGRLCAGAISFVIPLIIAILFPQIFITALGSAGIALSIIAIIVPVLIGWRFNLYNQMGLMMAFIIGFVIILVEIVELLGFPLKWVLS